MSHDHDSEKKYDVATHALVPMLLMLFIEMSLNFYAAPQNAIFLSPYLLAFLIASLISFFVLWKAEICPGQTGRLTFVLKFFLVFAMGHLLYVIGFTPKYVPLTLASIAAVMLPIIYWRLPEDEKLYNTVMYCGFGIAGIGILLYLLVYWVEIPSIFNGVRANNFAQLLLGILLAGWYLMLAKSRLEGFFKLLVLLALVALVLNYCWSAFVLYQQLQVMPEMSIMPYFIYFALQFVICAALAWLLLGKSEKQIKNPLAWTVATLCAMLYPFVNAF